MRRIETSIDIDAAPAVVWEVLTDFSQWSEWSRTMTIVSAEPTLAGLIRFIPRFEGAPPLTFSARVVDWDPGRGFAWLGSPLGWRPLGWGRHWFRLDAVDGGTQLCQGETFGGLTAPLMPRAFFGVIEASFMAFNSALKARMEPPVACPLAILRGL